MTRHHHRLPPCFVSLSPSVLHSTFANHDTNCYCIAADHIMGLPTLLCSILGFPHPEDISPCGTPVCVFVYISDLKPTKPCSHEVAESQPIHPCRSSLLVHTMLSLTCISTDPRTPCDDKALHGHKEPGESCFETTGTSNSHRY